MTDRKYVSLPWYESLQPTLQGGHEVALLDSGAGFFPALEEAIASATMNRPLPSRLARLMLPAWLLTDPYWVPPVL